MLFSYEYYENYFIVFILAFFFHEYYFDFFMFQNVPECSVLRVLSTPDF